MRPEDALAQARRAAEEARARGAYAGDVSGFEVAPTDRPSTERLLEWAVIEPDVDLVYSTRRYGAPITAVKRGLVRALRQYLGQGFAQQTRFNIQLAVLVGHLQERVERLEEQAARARER